MGPAPPPGDVILRAETTLDATRWQGARATPEDRMDVRQRLGVRARLGDPRLTLDVDLELGSDFGPEPDAWSATPDPRRAVVDVYAARLDARDLFGRLDATLGRHLLYDVLGADALDGLTLGLRAAPFLVVGASAGLAARRGWSGFGPDVFEPDGTALRDEPATVLRARLGTRGLSWLHAQAGWTRHFDTYVQREEASAAARIGPEILNVDASLRYAIALHELADAQVGLASGGDALGRRPLAPPPTGLQPRQPLERLPPGALGRRRGGGGARMGAWHLAADGALRWYAAGPAKAQTPPSPSRRRPIPSPRPDPPRWAPPPRGSSTPPDRARGSAWRAAPPRATGARRHADVFARLPLLYQPGRAPAWIRARLGAVALAELTDPAAWALLAAEWSPEETMTLEALGELYAGGPDATRFRMLLRLRLEEWW
ncbi:MAG: hypothetical protein R3F60_26295 [bacterium]